MPGMICTGTDSQGGSGNASPAGPQISRTASLKNRINPKVASTWSR